MLIWKRHKKFICKSLFLLIAATAVVASYVGFLQLTGNFHAVVVGEIYRSAQPTETQIAEYKALYGIQTIINLRGKNIGDPWYDKEVETARRLEIKHIDFGMSASQELSQEQAETLIRLLEKAPKPMLIHCMSGADRTGLAAALYLAAISRQGEIAAERQLSIRYGHFGIPHLSSAYAMERTFEKLEPWLGFSGS